jgi:hypothetical protein
MLVVVMDKSVAVASRKSLVVSLMSVVLAFQTS